MERSRFAAASVVIGFVLVGCSANVPSASSGVATGSAANAVAVGRLVRLEDPALGPVSSPLRHIPGELLVRFRPGSADAARSRLAVQAGAERLRAFRSVPGLELLRERSGTSSGTALAALQQSAEVLYAEPNYVLHVLTVPNDPSYRQQWGLHNDGQAGGVPGADVHAEEAWNVTTGSRGPVVAIIDTGIDATHPDLAPNLWSNPLDCNSDGADDDGDGYVDDCHGVDVTTGTGNPVDDNGHGTHVAGIIGAAGNNAVGVAGVNWVASLVACKYLDADGYGSTADAIACLDWVAGLKDRGVNVVATNDSWGGGMYSSALADAIAAQRQRGILFITAAGNDALDDDTVLQYPCSLPSPNVICVGATDETDEIAWFSNSGPHTVHMLAPGQDVLSTVPVSLGSYEQLSGTSMAAPLVTGAVALLHAQQPGADWRMVLDRLLVSGTPAPSQYTAGMSITGRRLNLAGVLSCSAAPVTRRLRPYVVAGNYTNYAGVGPIELAALSVDCGGPHGDVTVGVGPYGAAPTSSVVLNDDGVAPDSVAGDGIYSAAWTPPGPGDYTLTFPGNDLVYYKVDAELRPGFPVKTWYGPGMYHGGPNNAVVVGNIDGDPGLELIVSGLAAGPLFAFKADGRPEPGWPVLDGGTGVGYPALAMLDPARPGRQVVATYFDGYIAAYDGAGALLPGWPQVALGFDAAAATADVDGDGLDEIFAQDCYRADGNELAPDCRRWRETTNAAIADVDGDGLPEAVTTTAPVSPGGSRLDVRRPDGTSLPGFPVAYDGAVDSFPVVGDVNGDGVPEIVVVAANGIVIFARDGRLLRTIPLADTIGYGTAPALADLDGDGTLDIVVETGQGIEAWRGDGTSCPGWPVTFTVPYDEVSDGQAPVVGDVDGDGLPDVVAVAGADATYGAVYAWNHAGRPLVHFPKTFLPIGPGITPAIADIDGDGRNEIIVGGDQWGGHSGYFEKLWVFDLGGTAYGPVVWGQFMGNAQHTGTLVPAAAPRRTFYRVSIAPTGAGQVQSQPFGINCGTVCSRTYPAGTSLELTATPDPGYQAVWSGACAMEPATCTLQVDGPKVIGVAFVPVDDRLTVSRIGTGSGSVSSTPAGISCGATCSSTFARGTSVTLTATADAGSTFVGFGGACVGPTCLLSLVGDHTVTARFDLLQQPVTVAKTGDGTGTVTSVPAGISCGSTCLAEFDQGTMVTLTATAASGSMFAGWLGDCSGSAATCQVVASAARSATARFDAVSEPYHTVSVARIGTGSGMVTSSPAAISCGSACAASFMGGATVTFTASPASGSSFAGWSGACTGSGTCEFTVNSDVQVNARFDASGGGGGGGGGGGCNTGADATLLGALALGLLLRRRPGAR